MKRSLSSLFVVIPFLLFCQNTSNYTPLENKGEIIPQDFLNSTKEVVESEKEEFTASETKKEKKLKEKFLIQSTFSTTDFLQTGVVCFNDPISEYVNAVADNVLKNDPALRSKLRFYAAKIPDANAMAFNNGIVLINVGLIAQLENESQLAFIIAHEISHYVNQDAIVKYIEFDRISKGKGLYGDLTSGDKEIQQFKYSKEIETHADEDGLALFLNSDYDVASIENVFDVLKYSYLPIDEIPFDKAFIESANYKIKDEFLLSEISSIDAIEEDEDEEKQTHPSTSSRKNNISMLLDSNNKGGDKVYLQGYEKFEEIRKLSRYELSRIYLKYGLYEEAIYNSYVLLQLYPDDLYLKKNVAKSITAIAMHVNTKNSLSSKRINVEKDVQGQSQQLYYIIKKMMKEDKEGLNVLALSYVYELFIEYAEDLELKTLFENLVESMVKDGSFKISELQKKKLAKDEFSTSPHEEEVISVQEVDSLLDIEIAKFENVEKKTKLDKIEETVVFGPYMQGFVDYMNDSLFTNTFKATEERLQNREDWLANWQKMSNKEKKENYNPWDIKKVVIIDPFFAKIAAKKNEKYKIFESEKGEYNYSQQLKKISEHKKIELEVDILDYNNLENVSTLNDLFLAKEWFSEQSRLDKEIEFSSIETERINDLVEKYGTEYFMWTGVVDLKDGNALRSFISIYASVIFPPGLLFSIPKTITKANYTIHFNFVQNIKTGQVIYANVDDVNFKTRPSLLDAKIYTELYKISKR